MSLSDRFARLSTAAKLLLILTAAILPIGIALTWVGESGIRQANAALGGRAECPDRDDTTEYACNESDTPTLGHDASPFTLVRAHLPVST